MSISRQVAKYSTKPNEPEMGCSVKVRDMKKSVYAAGGTLMVIVAVLLKTLAGGGPELALLLIVGLALLLASADMPTKSPQTNG